MKNQANNSNKYGFYLKGTNGKGVLLIHGITGTPSEMRHLGKAINDAGYTVLCSTLPKHCSSLSELKKVTWQEIVKSCIADFQKLKAECQKVFVGGLSMGALLAIHIACEFPENVTGIVALAPTVFYDGWALHKGRHLIHLVWHIPVLRNMVNIREGWPYGLKDETLRDNISRFYKDAKASEFDKKVLLFGSPFFPVACLYQHHLFAKVVKKELKNAKAPILIMHAKEDDMVSIKNARYILDSIGSLDKSLAILEDSYHMITIDNDKDRVAEEAIRFLDRL